MSTLTPRLSSPLPLRGDTTPTHPSLQPQQSTIAKPPHPPPKRARKPRTTRPSMNTHFATPQDSAYLIATTGGIIFVFGLITCFDFAWYTLPMMTVGSLMGYAPWSGWLIGVLEKNSATGEDEKYRGFQGENRQSRRERLAREKARKMNREVVGQRRGLGRI